MMKEATPTKGFITIATGKPYYYQLAANLVQSYRYHTKQAMPFAILAEEENEYTALFDDVVVVKDAKRTFMDKFLLFELCPYDETIFIDADSLCYGDLNAYWDLFKDATDFSAVGGILDKEEMGGGNYDIANIGKYADSMPYKVWIHAGVCFFRKSPKLKKLCDNCMDIVENYQTLKDLRNAGSYDEVSLGIAMPMNDMQPKEELDTMLAFMPCCKWVEADIIAGKLSYEKVNGVRVKDDGIFLHFTTRMTHTPLYEHEVLRLAAQLKGKKATIVDKVKAGQVYRNWLQIKYKAKNLFASCLNLPQRIYSRLNRFTN